ncbi:MAG TPA: hypothetical protein VEG60_05295 [Candidatus Binatia bacterium]|nr:hypothetical protein [Candidatus Binatia bacterium]
MSLKSFPAFIVLVALPLFYSSSWADDVNIYFKATPRLELLHPYSDPATLTLLVTGADGKPVTQGWVAIRLEAPEPGWFLSTDFPLVEGSRLLEMSLPLRKGRAEWKYLFPIRGEYRLSVEFTALDGQKATKTFTIAIRENRQKWFFLGIFSLALFALGVTAGRIFTSSRSSPVGEIAAILVLSLGSLMASVGSVAVQAAERSAQFGWLEIDPAIVGKPSKVRWRLAGDANGESRAVLLTLTIAHLEKEKTVFSLERLPIDREFALSFQFIDAAEYRVTALAQVVGGRMLRTEQNMTVIGVEPPGWAMIPAIGFFLAVIAVGLAVGRWSRRTASSAES